MEITFTKTTLTRRVASYTQIRTCVLKVTRKFWNFKLIVSIFYFYLYATKISLWKHHFDWILKTKTKAIPCSHLVLHCAFLAVNKAVLFGQRATKRRSCKGATFQERSWQRSDVPRTLLAIPVTLAQPKQRFVCAKLAQNKGKTLCSLLAFTQLFRKRNKELSIFRLVYLGF